jgi:proline racemase
MTAADPRTRRQTLQAVDSHTCGQPTRVIVGGVPELEYDSVGEARDRLREEHDWIRRCAVFEPHGHRALFAAALVPAVDRTCATGIVFMDAAGYHDMCGHATIGVITTLVDNGGLDFGDGDHTVAVETPAGRIETRVQVVDGAAASVAFVNQPAFFLESLEVSSSVGDVPVEIAYGGQWYAFVDAEAFGLRIEPGAIGELIARAAELRPVIAAAVTGEDPRTGKPARVENVMWTDRPSMGADGRNMPVNAAGSFDRSPCGTGTSARLALLHAQGSLQPDEPFVNQSVLGTTYTGRIVDVTSVAGRSAVVPEVTGSAWVTGASELWVDPTDPLGEGFLL